MAEQVNRFFKGVKKFKDYSLYSNDEWTFPALNVRVVNKDNQGFILVAYGNTEERFSVGTDMVITGVKDYKGILYITSCKNDNSGVGEIGCYPSPKWNGTTGFDNSYKALKIYDNSGRSYLTTNKLKYKTTNRTSIIIKENQDQSVNLYITDYLNPIHVINSGFDQTGLMNDYLITNDMFNGFLNLVPTTIKELKLSLYQIEDGGKHKPGTYYAFARYVTADYTYSSFKEEVYPIVIAKGNNSFDIQGVQNLDLDLNQNYTNKQFSLLLNTSTVDQSFDYIQIAIIRYFSDEFGNISSETYLISNLYEIKLLLLNPYINISGYENTESFTIEDIMSVSNSYTINKTHVQLDNRYYGANWKKMPYDKTSLLAYASAIVPTYNCDTEIEDYSRFEAYEYWQQAGVERKGQYRNFLYANSNLGYFRGEIYPFAIKGVLADGSETEETFPICGADMLNPSSIVYEAATIKTGLVRFPQWVDVDNVGNQNYIMGIQFNNAASLALTGLDLTNIIGFKIVRGDRVENLIYQGLSFNVLDTIAETGTLKTIKGIAKIPIVYDDDVYNVKIETVDTDKDYFYTQIMDGVIDSNRTAIFSPDYLFEKQSNKSSYSSVKVKELIKFSSIRPSGTYSQASTQIVKFFDDSPVERNPNILCLDFNTKYNTTSTKSIVSNTYTCDLNKIDDGTYNGVNGFTSLIMDYETDPSKVLYYLKSDDIIHGYSEHFSRSLKFARYLGLKSNSTISSIVNSIVNIYISENNTAYYNTIKSSFSVKNTKYWDITNVNAIGTSLVVSGRNIVFKGDCFLQRTWFRIVTNFGFGGNGNDTDPFDASEYRYGFGILVSVITENKYNSAMRNEVHAVDPDNPANEFDYSFFPKIRDNGMYANTWVIPDSIDKIYEAFQLNYGYNKSDALLITYGIDVNILNSRAKLPTRIYFSEKQNNGSVIDSYRLIGPSSYQDYDIKDGEINCLETILSFLISFQDKSVNQHFIGTKEMTQQVSSSDIVLQVSNTYLHDKVKVLAQYGTQHQFSVISSGNAIYAVDFANKIIMAVTFGEGGELICKDIVMEGEVKGHTDEIFNYFASERKVTDVLADDTLNDLGIHSGYNPDYKEIMFTFLYDIVVSIEIWGDQGYLEWGDQGYLEWTVGEEFNEGYITYYDNKWYYSLVNLNIGNKPDESPTKFAEIDLTEFEIFEETTSFVLLNLYYSKEHHLLFYFIGNQGTGTGFGDLDSYLYIDESNLLNGLNCRDTRYKKTLVYNEEIKAFTSEVSFVPNIYYKLGNRLYSSLKTNVSHIHDQDGNVNTFYGEKYPMSVSIIVTGQEAREIVKEFMNYEIDMPDVVLQKIDFEADYQRSSLDPFSGNEFYLEPEYLENKWCGPIPLNELNKQEFFEESAMKGYWLKMTLYYNGNQSIFVRKIITYFNQSFI